MNPNLFRHLVAASMAFARVPALGVIAVGFTSFAGALMLAAAPFVKRRRVVAASA